MLLAFLELAALTFIGELLRPKPEVAHAKPAGFDEFGLPTVEVGRPVPVVFGRVRHRGPNVLWYGDYRTLPIVSVQKIKGLFKKKTVNQTIGHRYFVGFHFGLAHAGVTGVHRIWSEERVAWEGTLAPPGDAAIDAPHLFGGPNDGGGLVGTMSFAPGGVAQTVHPYLSTHLGAGLAPAFRGITAAVWQGGEVGNSPRLAPLSFELSRYPSALGLGAVGSDANPAEVAWEVLTNPVWGLGAPASLFDSASFSAAGTTLASESHGFSVLWDARRTVGDFLTEVMRQVDGVIYPSLRDAKVKLALARGGADPESIPVLDPSNVVQLKQHTRASVTGTINELKVLFNSRASGYKEDAATAFNLANFLAQDRVVSSPVRYPGVSVLSLANQLAWRDLRALTTELLKVTLVCNRQAHRLEPGDVFSFRWPPLNVGQVVMRVTDARAGAPGSTAIELDAVEDVFSIADSVFGAPPASLWTDPVEDVEPVALQRIDETPYLLLARDDGSAAAGTVDPDDARVMLTAARPNRSTTGADVQTRVAPAPYAFRTDLAQFAPTATLVAEYPRETDAVDGSGSLVVEGLVDGELLEDADPDEVSGLVRNWALLGAEVVAWETITDNGDGTWTQGNVWRGVMDTVPTTHAAGTRIWFASEGATAAPDTHAQGTTVQARLVPSTPRGELDPDDATPLSHVVARRSLRPYPPGRVRVNEETWPEAIVGELVLTWAHRDRTAQDGVVDQDEGDVGPEAGVTYTLRIYDEDDVLIRTETGLTGTSYTYSNEVADAGRLQGRLRIELESVRAGFASHQFQEREFLRYGWGLNWGLGWGGLP